MFISIDKSKALSLVLHCCDISHPAKRWTEHHQWTSLLLEEFFLQGERESDLGLPFSPLCDRKNTLVAESQIGKSTARTKLNLPQSRVAKFELNSISLVWMRLTVFLRITFRTGFIEFIVEPSMGVCSDMLDYILAPLNASNSGSAPPSATSIVEEGSK